MFVNTENNRKLIDFLLINSHSIGSNGIAYGKSGICLALFESSAFLKDEKLEGRAFGLLQEILVHPASDISFSNGAAGIGFLLSYLLQNSFLSGNYRELFGSQHRHILETIKSPVWTYNILNIKITKPPKTINYGQTSLKPAGNSIMSLRLYYFTAFQ